MNKVIFYYGVENPPKELLPLLHDHILIVQPYHPLSVSNRWREVLPACTKVYMYFNCTKISLDEAHENFLITEGKIDENWNAFILDLSRSRVFHFMQQRAQGLLSRHFCDGLFLDDMDQAILSGQEKNLLNLINNLVLGSGHKFILNRGFGIWDKIRPVETIVLESFIPSQYPHPTDLDWFDSILTGQLAPYLSNNPKASFHVIDYGLTPKAIGHDENTKKRVNEIEQKMAGLPLAFLTANKELNRWPEVLN